MKIIYLTLLLSISIYNSKAQWVTIPDTNFVNFLTQEYPSCMSGNQMDTTCTDITSEISLNCSSWGIASLDGIQFFDSLDTLKCRNNLLSGLPSLPTTITEFQCDTNQLTSLPDLPSGLIRLLCSYNQLSTLPTLPLTVQTIDTRSNSISVLPSLPNSLNVLNCSDNQISVLPPLPINLGIFDCRLNFIDSIPTLPQNLNHFWCDVNQISTIPNLPLNLIQFTCGQNFITSFPPLPNSLLIFSCGYNPLGILPPLPPFLERLECVDNQLSVLPSLPSSLLSLTCGRNQLTFIPELPDTLDWLDISSSPNLICLPQLKFIDYFTFDSIGAQCLPSYGTILHPYPSLTTLPLCDVLNANGCDVFWNISGKAYNDVNGDCIADSNELGLKNLKISLSGGGTMQQVYTGGEGFYSFDTDTGSFTYTIDTTGVPVLVACPLSGFHNSNITLPDSIDYSMDFGLKCVQGFDVGVQSIKRSSPFFPGNHTKVEIDAGDMSNFYNLHCATGVNGQVIITLVGPVSFISAAPGALTPIVSGNVLTYNISDFYAVNFYTDFQIVLKTDTSAQSGDKVCMNVEVTPIVGDNNPSNNNLTYCFNVVNSYDPNEKEVNPAGNVSPNQEWLTYTIYFQNTGSAPAQNIYIIDTLDNNIDPESFTLLAYSHKNLTQVNGNIIRVSFPAIHLPDSTNNEPNSHGYVQYKVRLRPGLALGTAIANTANIYFDFNTPIRTNTTTNTVSNLTSINEIAQATNFYIYPNPMESEARLSFELNRPGNITVEIFNLLGESMGTSINSKVHAGRNEMIISIAKLSQGIYHLRIFIGGKVTTKKIVRL